MLHGNYGNAHLHTGLFAPSSTFPSQQIAANVKCQGCGTSSQSRNPTLICITQRMVQMPRWNEPRSSFTPHWESITWCRLIISKMQTWSREGCICNCIFLPGVFHPLPTTRTDKNLFSLSCRRALACVCLLRVADQSFPFPLLGSCFTVSEVLLLAARDKGNIPSPTFPIFKVRLQRVSYNCPRWVDLSSIKPDSPFVSDIGCVRKGPTMLLIESLRKSQSVCTLIVERKQFRWRQLSQISSRGQQLNTRGL